MSGVVCERCDWALAPGEVLCSRCGADAPGAKSDSGRRMSLREKLTHTLETQLLGSLRSAVMGDYEILGRLGRGGMCAVYLAQDLALNRRVAIKLVLPELVSEFGIAQRRLKREARTAASLSHPSIIPVYAVRQVDDLVFFVMKHIEGRALSAVIKDKGALPIPTVVSILRQLGSGLEYAHRRGVIHRDIKPANIMLDREGWAVLADFGIAKVSDGQEITATGSAIGTPCYMSPEQCSGVTATMASDQYSLGIVAYEMLVGAPPFLGDSVASVITQHLFEPPPSVEEMVQDCPSVLSDVVARMLVKNPDERWPSIGEALEALGSEQTEDTEVGRHNMIELATSAVTISGEFEYSTPRSPTPIRRSQPGGVTASRDRNKKLRRKIMQRSMAALGVAAVSLMVSLMVVWVTSDPPGGSVPALAEDRAAPVTPAQPDGEQVQTAQGQTDSDREPSIPIGSGASGAATDHAAVVSQPAPVVRSPDPTPVAPVNGTIRLGTRGQAAVLYVNGEAMGIIEGLQSWSVIAGTVRLRIDAEGCQPWDSTVVVQPGATTRIGYRQPSCNR